MPLPAERASSAPHSAWHWRDFPHPITAGLVAVVVSYGGPFILIFQAARAANLPPELTASWVWAISIGAGATGLMLSWAMRMPIITAWSTPGAALLVGALTGMPYAEAIGAYLLSAAAFIVLGLSGQLERAVRLIPASLAAALLAGILLNFGVQAFASVNVDAGLAALLIFAYLVLKRLAPRYAVLGILLLGLVWLIVRHEIDLSWLSLSLTLPVATAPVFTLAAALNLALPMFLVTLTGQYLPGLLVLRHDGFAPNSRAIVSVTGLGSLLLAPFGAHALNLAAITAAIATGPQAHREPAKRWLAGVVAGLCYVLVGVFGLTLVAVFIALPTAFVATLAGLALLGTLGASLAQALAEPATREAALMTFLAAAANMSFAGIGGVFWALVIGVLAHGLLGSGRARPG